MNAQQLLDDYERDGVVRIRSLFSPDEVRAMRENLERYQRDILPGLERAEYTLEPDGKTVRNLWRLHKYDPYFEALAQRRDLLDLMSPYVHGEARCRGVESFNKPARVGSAVPWHQDNAYFCSLPPDVLTLWIALDPATQENGAVIYACGSQHKLYPHAPSGVQGNSFGLVGEPSSEFKQFQGTLEPGDALVHHCQTIHRSDPNRSDRSRTGLILVYEGTHIRTDPGLQAEYKKAYDLMMQAATAKAS